MDNYVPPFFRRLASALFFQYNVILFLGALVFAAAAGSWAPAIVASLVEAVWLAIATLSPVGYRWVEERRALMRRASFRAAHAEALRGLAPGYVERFDGLARACDDVRRAKLDMTEVSQAELRTTIGHLEEVLRSFLRLAALHQRLSQFLSGMPAADLEREAARMADAFTREKDLAVRLALRQSLGLHQRRMQQREQTANTEKAIDLQMLAIEQSFLYLETHVLGLGSARELKAEIDAFIGQVSSVDNFEAEAGNAMAGASTASRSSYPIGIAVDTD